MSLKRLREGIESRDWVEVIDAFESMTGEDLGIDLDGTTDDIEDIVVVPKAKRGRPKKVVVQDKSKTKSRIKVKADPHGPLVNPNRPNIFDDLLPILSNTEEDKKARDFDKKCVYNAVKHERREKVKKIKVRCTVCGKDKRIYPSEFIKLNEDSRYRCNEC